jgi:peptide/nickel transport system permease protein
MTKYIIRRILISIPVLVGISFLVFMLMQAAPGGPLAAFGLNPTLTQEQLEAIIKAWGLDKSPLEQYWSWFTSMLRGDWGTSFITRRAVLDEILSRVPATLLLTLTAFILQQLIALPLGMLSALKRYSFTDKLFTTLSYIGFSTPTFWLGILLVYFFAANLRILPTGGITDAREPTFNTQSYWEWWSKTPNEAFSSLIGHLILPVATLVIVGIATDSRYMRSSMIETMNQDYIRTARAKGLSSMQVVTRHALRPSLLPVVTNITLTLPTLIAGAIVTETIFSWPGMGKLFIDSVNRADYPVMIGIVFILSTLILIFNLIADVSYAILDPRIRV